MSAFFPGPETGAPDAPRVFTVSALTRDIQDILESAFDAIWVEGEISNYRAAASQHVYFVLKDAQAQARCVMFRAQRARLKFAPADGDQVLLRGRVSVYKERGEYQIIVSGMEPRGLGALQKAFEQLKEKLAREGLFDAARKKPLPPFPWKVGVVTSPAGAAVRDIIQVITRRNPRVSVLLCPVKVQGDGAAEEIARGIEAIQSVPGVEALIVGRGGGSIEDLWAFNEERVARAIHASRLPVISAVGHETDFTIADFVADARAPTPSAAAEIAVPVLADVLERLRGLAEELIAAPRGQMAERRRQLRQLMGRRFFQEPARLVTGAAQRLDDLQQRLERGLEVWRRVRAERLGARARALLAMSPGRGIAARRGRLAELRQRLSAAALRALAARRERLASRAGTLRRQTPSLRLARLDERRAALSQRLAARMTARLQLWREQSGAAAQNLNALSPLAVLRRGYSIATAAGAGKAITRASEVQPGDKVRLRLHEGQLDCRVESGGE